MPGEDAGDDLWRTYYANIFNPARLKVDAMKREMPVKYWKNLPESRLIAPLVRSAQEKEAAMVKAPQESVPRRAAIITRALDEARAAEVTASPNGLDALREQAQSCKRCALYGHATQTVFGEGLPSADLVFVGEQPGDKEDLAGKPFIGPAGAMFDRALGEAGIDRKRAYVTNAVKHFKFEPRGKRRIHMKPGVGEIDACRWWIEQELAMLRPKLTIALGATAVRSLTGKSASVLSVRGQVLPSPVRGAGFRDRASVLPAAPAGRGVAAGRICPDSSPISWRRGIWRRARVRRSACECSAGATQDPALPTAGGVVVRRAGDPLARDHADHAEQAHDRIEAVVVAERRSEPLDEGVRQRRGRQSTARSAIQPVKAPARSRRSDCRVLARPLNDRPRRA